MDKIHQSTICSESSDISLSESQKINEKSSLQDRTNDHGTDDKLETESESQTELCGGFCQECDWVNLDNFDSVNEKLKELEPILYDSFRVQSHCCKKLLKKKEMLLILVLQLQEIRRRISFDRMMMDVLKEEKSRLRREYKHLKNQVRGSQGTLITDGPPSFKRSELFPGVTGNMCRCMAFSVDGNLLSLCDSASVRIFDLANGGLVCEIDKPRTGVMQFSPGNTILATWEPYMVTKDQAAGTPNLNLWNVRTEELIKGFVQKKQQGWCPQWSEDEGICARNVNNEVPFYEGNNFGTICNKLHLQKVQDFRLSPRGGKPYHVAAYVPGFKGQPSFVRVYRYPNFAGPGAALANKSFFKADKCDMLWNNKGSALLVITVTDTSAESYYGEQGLHFVGTDGESCLVPRGKNGPIYNVEWHPNSTEFCVVYGFMPAKASLFNLKCDPIFDFGTGPRNAVYFNPQGNMLVLAGFGNLHGNIEVWDLSAKKMISNPKAPDCTYFEWCPDGQHLLTATTSPRLRVGNGHQVWHYTGTLLHDTKVGKDQELWEAVWQPALEGQYPEPKISYKPIATTTDGPAQPKAEAKAYVPPHLRNNPQAQAAKAKAPKFREEYEKPSNQRQETAPGNMSKAALKNMKRKEARRAKAAAEGREVPAAAAAVQVNAQASSAKTSDLSDTEKKIRNIRKKLQQVKKLKEQQASGKKLELNQVEKIKSEASLLEELKQLTI